MDDVRIKFRECWRPVNMFLPENESQVLAKIEGVVGARFLYYKDGEWLKTRRLETGEMERIPIKGVIEWIPNPDRFWHGFQKISMNADLPLEVSYPALVKELVALRGQNAGMSELQAKYNIEVEERKKLKEENIELHRSLSDIRNRLKLFSNKIVHQLDKFNAEL